MLARKHWNILVVDDEPDVHEVTDLLLKREEIFGAKLQLLHAHSAAEAKNLLNGNLALRASLAAALVDVVMETDHAGLDFCRYIREENKNQATALILRTGQPGQAPPRQVIDDFNISSYLTKVEATRDRLYTVIKTGVQHFFEVSSVQYSNVIMDYLRESCASPAELLAGYEKAWQGAVAGGSEIHVACDFFGKHYAGAGFFQDKSAYLGIKDELLARAGAQLVSTPQKPRRFAQVDPYSIVQFKTLGKEELSTLVVKDAVLPRNLLYYYSGIWIQPLAYIAEVLSRG